MYTRTVSLALRSGQASLTVMGSATFGPIAATLVAEDSHRLMWWWRKEVRGYGSPYTQHLLGAATASTAAGFEPPAIAVGELGEDLRAALADDREDALQSIECRLGHLREEAAKIEVFNRFLAGDGEERYDLRGLIALWDRLAAELAAVV